MKKHLGVIFACVFVLSIATMAMAGTKSLCELPFGQNGNLEVMYDQRNYDLDYMPGSYPNGGIRFELWLGTFPTAEDRDEVADNIKRVTFINLTTGSSFRMTKPDKFIYVGDYSAEISFWCGKTDVAIGTWMMIVSYLLDNYIAFFQITQEMIDQYPPLPVDPQVLPPVGGFFDIVAQVTNGEQYRLRIFDEAGDIITNDNMTIDGDMVRHTYPESLMGLRARIETRLYGLNWPLLTLWGQPETCNAWGMNPSGNGMSRSVISFNTTVLP